MKQADITEQIIGAFAPVERPDASDIAPHECDECERVRRLLIAHAFDCVPDSTINWLSDSLPLLGPKGLHYYLPAYLLRALRDPDCRGIDYLLNHLAPTDKDLNERADYWKERLAVFSSAQRAAILAFVGWLGTTAIEKEYPDELARARSIWSEAA